MSISTCMLSRVINVLGMVTGQGRRCNEELYKIIQTKENK